jgi:hypothetical protein
MAAACVSERSCLRCGEFFTPKRSKSRYCDACRNAAKQAAYRNRNRDVPSREELSRWWLERFTVEEIRELAAGLALWLDDARDREEIGAAA